MAITDYHSKLFSTELMRRCPSDSVEKFTAALLDSQVDLNPHQVDAALFAFRSPLSKGAILADEVGLGKTIEAGIVLSQKWSERKRKILIILPSSLRKQWHQELLEKFYLPSQILEAKSFNKAIKDGRLNPFDMPEIVICSYYFARNKASYIQSMNWDLVVIDEAHRLRNVYKTGNKVARELRSALSHAPKMLLTATPLQNSLLELYGLVSFIDEHVFGDLKSFREQFARLNDETFTDLKARLKLVCKRTLRRQVTEYIRYTERKAHTQEFMPTPDEMVLYDLVSDYLRRPTILALPAGQRTLMTLVMRKMLSSSTYAIAGALDALANKLERQLKAIDAPSSAESEFEEDFEEFDDLRDELEVDDVESIEMVLPSEREAMEAEIVELRSFCDLAMSVSQNAKGEALLQALGAGFQMATGLGGAEKAIIFTESRRTQRYLLQLLANNGYGDDIVLFNGSNNDEKSRAVYAAWKQEHEGTDMMTGSRSADVRAALVDCFRDEAKIMIATEAAAEGINLQFCSLVVNYDLPWNPQRIEQRIGRCHRYGQKHDVVVVNFLNKANAADQRVYELLSEKFHLFKGVFGASDEVLGSIESGVDFEKRIMEIYQECRTPEQIQQAFDALQQELGGEIDETMKSTRKKLLENFDTEVAEKLNVCNAEATASLSRYESLLWEVAKHELGDRAFWFDDKLLFKLKDTDGDASYTLKKGQDEKHHHFRIQHPLAQDILTTAMGRELPSAELTFNYSQGGKKITILEDLVGQGGSLIASLFSISALESEDYILFAGKTEQGQKIDSEQCSRLFDLPASGIESGFQDDGRLEKSLKKQEKHLLGDISERNAVFFDEEMEKLDKWAADQQKTLKSDLKDLDEQIKELKKEARRTSNLPDKLKMRRKTQTLEKKRDTAWKAYDSAAREIEQKKDELIDEVEARLDQQTSSVPLFHIRWKLI
jgi:SNF2 family DNA or RNA helicase